MKFLNIDKSTIYILPILVLLATNDLFHPFAYKGFSSRGGFALEYSLFTSTINKLAGLASVIVLILNLKRFTGYKLIIYILVFFYFVILVFESIYYYNVPLKYPHVILKFLNLFLALAVFALYSKHIKVKYTIVMNFIVLGLLMKIVIEPEMLSFQSFVSHERGLPANSVFLLSLPCLYFFNQFATKLSPYSLLKFLFIFLFILIANHRTVWVTISFSLLINLLFIRNNVDFKVKKFLQSIVLVSILSGYIFALAISYNSSIEDKITTNVNNILNPEKDATASWRLLQMESYWPIIEDNFIAGLRWKGFELPIQFYHPEAGTPYFEDGLGHFFHSFYLDILFYFGIIGLLIFLAAMIMPFVLVIKNQISLNNMQLTFYIFSLTGLIYGLSYTLTFHYWLIFGLTMAHLELANRKIGIAKAQKI